MQKLRDLYKETQKNANQNFDRVTQERMKKILALANKEYQSILTKNDFTYLDEVTFYRQKFQQIVDTLNEAQEKGYKKQKVQALFIDILKPNFLPPQFNEQPQQYLPQGQKEIKTANKKIQIVAPSQVIKSYFDVKQQEIQRTKIGFRSVIQDIPFIPKKFPVKGPSPKKILLSSQVKHIVQPKTEQQIKALKHEIERLKKQLADKEGQKQFRFGLLQIEKKQYQQRIQELNHQLKKTQSQNAALKEQSAKNYQIAPLNSQPYYISPVVNHQLDQQKLYNPYQIKFRQNDINKINNKLTKPKVFSNNLQNPIHGINHLMNKFDQYQKFEGNNQIDLNAGKHKNSFSGLNISNNQSGVKQQDNNIALKSKISFFKPSMILYHGDQFQIAVKSLDEIRLQKKKLIIYVNNRTNSKQAIKLHYKFDPNYYSLSVKRKLNTVDELTQGKQQVQVILVNSIDLDSLIEVQMTVNTRNIAFLLPLMFIQFLDKRPQMKNQQKYQTQRIIPIHQFSNLAFAQEFIPIEKIYGQHEQAGRIYAISKNHEGYIYFRWSGGLLEIRTISTWKNFFGYILLKQY